MTSSNFNGFERSTPTLTDKESLVLERLQERPHTWYEFLPLGIAYACNQINKIRTKLSILARQQGIELGRKELIYNHHQSPDSLIEVYAIHPQARPLARLLLAGGEA